MIYKRLVKDIKQKGIYKPNIADKVVVEDEVSNQLNALPTIDNIIYKSNQWIPFESKEWFDTNVKTPYQLQESVDYVVYTKTLLNDISGDLIIKNILGSKLDEDKMFFVAIRDINGELMGNDFSTGFIGLNGRSTSYFKGSINKDTPGFPGKEVYMGLYGDLSKATKETNDWYFVMFKKDIVKKSVVKVVGGKEYTFTSPLNEINGNVSIQSTFVSKVNESINEAKANELISNAIGGIDLSQVETNKQDIANINSALENKISTSDFATSDFKWDGLSTRQMYLSDNVKAQLESIGDNIDAIATLRNDVEELGNISNTNQSEIATIKTQQTQQDRDIVDNSQAIEANTQKINDYKTSNDLEISKLKEKDTTIESRVANNELVNTTQTQELESLKTQVAALIEKEKDDINLVGEIIPSKTYNFGDFGFVGDKWYVALKDSVSGDVSNTTNWKEVGFQQKVNLSNYYNRDEVNALLTQKVDNTTYTQDKATLGERLSAIELKNTQQDSAIETKLDKSVYEVDKPTFALKTQLRDYVLDSEYQTTKQKATTNESAIATINSTLATKVDTSTLSQYATNESVSAINDKVSANTSAIELKANSSDLANYQLKLKAGTNITISEDNTISATGGGVAPDLSDYAKLNDNQQTILAQRYNLPDSDTSITSSTYGVQIKSKNNTLSLESGGAYVRVGSGSVDKIATEKYVNDKVVFSDTSGEKVYLGKSNLGYKCYRVKYWNSNTSLNRTIEIANDVRDIIQVSGWRQRDDGLRSCNHAYTGLQFNLKDSSFSIWCESRDGYTNKTYVCLDYESTIK